MFLITKKVAGLPYYYNTEKAMWYGLKENATKYETVLHAANYLREKSHLRDATIIPYSD